jgi:hypothetical protein
LIEDAHHIIADGVYAFWFVQCNSMDSNTRRLRTDFLVRRLDRLHPDVRLHPQTVKNKNTSVAEAIPVYGAWEDWRPGAGIGSYAIAASQESRLVVRDPASVVGFENFSNVDRVGKLAAREFLRQEMMCWEGLPHPRGVFKTDLTDGRKFPWHLYVTNTSWHAGMFDGELGIHAFGYGWHAERKGVVFWGVAIDGRNFIVDLSQRLHSELQWNETVSDR